MGSTFYITSIVVKILHSEIDSLSILFHNGFVFLNCTSDYVGHSVLVISKWGNVDLLTSRCVLPLMKSGGVPHKSTPDILLQTVSSECS